MGSWQPNFGSQLEDQTWQDNIYNILTTQHNTKQ